MVVVRLRGTGETLVPADGVARLLGALRRVPARGSDTSPAVVARELLEAARAGRTEACVLEGAVAWEVLWAVQGLPADAMSPALEVLHTLLLRLTSAPLRREREAHAEAPTAAVTRLR